MATIKLAALVEKVLNCTLCQDHLPHGIRPVFQLHPAASILIAGQAPGIKVHRTGIPFNDPSGERLREWMGIDRDLFYDSTRIALLPMGLCYPGKGRSGDLPPRKECALEWRSQLLAQLPNIQLTLAVGQYAQDWHINNGSAGAGVTDNVLAWKKNWPALLPLPHPSPRNNFWLRNNPWFLEEVIPVLQSRVREILKL